jgi:hypothetical protein
MTTDSTDHDRRQQIARRLLEIYRRSQYRTTTSGQKIRWDEPGEGYTPEVQQHNRDLKKHQQKTIGKQRLKNKSAVPTKNGTPIFEELQVLDENTLQVLSTFRQLLQSNRTTNFRTWIKVVAKVLEDLD